VTETTSGQHSKKAVEVRYIERELRSGETVKPNVPAEKINEELPSKVSGTAGKGDNAVTVRGIPVTIEKVTQKLQDTWYNDEYRPVPGGCRMECEKEGPGTTCTPAYDGDINEYVIVTAGHLIEDEDPGYKVMQPDDPNSSSIGKSDNAFFHDDFDAATVDLKNGVDFKYGFADEPSGYVNNEEIYGTIAWTSIKDMEGNTSYKLTKQGMNTGREDGYIVWASDTNKIFETTAYTLSGDSGGPHFNIDGDKALIAGVHNYGEDTDGDGSFDDRAGATAMETVNNTFNLTI